MGDNTDKKQNICNVAKLREALQDICNAALQAIWEGEWQGDNPNARNYKKFLDYLTKGENPPLNALSAPPRNCDVGTAEEQDKRFDKFCMSRNYQSCRGCPIYSSPNKACAITWGQLPYEVPASKQASDGGSAAENEIRVLRDEGLAMANEIRELRIEHFRDVTKMVGDMAKLRGALENIIRDCQGGKSYDHIGMKNHFFDGIEEVARAALAASPRNCDRFDDEQDAQLAFLNEVWLISVDRETMLERDKYENWTDEMKTRYGRWLLAQATGQKGDNNGEK